MAEGKRPPDDDSIFFDEPPPHRDPDEMDTEEERRAFGERAQRKYKANGAQHDPSPDAQIAAMLATLTLDRWPAMNLPPRDWLIEGFLSTTTRMMIVGQTGAGKTLFALDLAAALATGGRMLDWPVKRSCRVMYLDGELPAETMQERTEAVTKVFGPSANLLILNRDVIPKGWMEPLNWDQGEAWLLKMVEVWKPDVIVYDSIAFLTLIDLKKPEEWQRVAALMNRLTGQRIGQILMHHTGYDASRSYGDATKEWNQDTVLTLAKPEDDDDENPSGRVIMRFSKARNRTPKTNHLYKAATLQRMDTGWAVQGKAPDGKKAASGTKLFERNFLECLDLLSEGRPLEPGANRILVRKVSVDEVRKLMRERGMWDQVDETMNPVERKRWQRGKEGLLGKQIVEQLGWCWRTPDRG